MNYSSPAIITASSAVINQRSLMFATPSSPTTPSKPKQNNKSAQELPNARAEKEEEAPNQEVPSVNKTLRLEEDEVLEGWSWGEVKKVEIMYEARKRRQDAVLLEAHVAQRLASTNTFAASLLDQKHSNYLQATRKWKA